MATTTPSVLTVAGAPGEGSRASFDGTAVEVTTGRHVLRIPLSAVHSVDVSPQTLMIMVTGDRATEPDTGAPQQIRYHSPAEARAFAEAVTSALARTQPRPGGLARVESRLRPDFLFHGWTGRVLAVWALLGLVTLPLLLGPTPEDTSAMLVLSAVLWPLAHLLVRFWWQLLVRDPLILLRRGVSVPGTVLRHRRNAGDNALYYPELRFTTAEGTVQETRSCVGRRLDGPPGAVRVRYDPRDPRRAGRPMTFAHLFWIAVLGGIALSISAPAGSPMYGPWAEFLGG
ncbi:DUF3592 domain-containing protein [Streptomyces sp. NPDC087440]|uniref:DUF3592 domain-containing protein n=1 Tax=Streptomyces sp. NPDC087440 TaxID=3365790 RepID=UPI0038225510